MIGLPVVATNFKYIKLISRYVTSAEGRILPNKPKPSFCNEASRVVLTHAPNSGVYLSSESYSYLSILGKLRLSRNTKFLDLGSGFGQICFVSELFYNDVTGVESDPELYNQAKCIAGLLGSNVSFIQDQFLNESFSLAGYDAIYFFKPFLQNYENMMFTKIITSRPGAILISNCHIFNQCEGFYKYFRDIHVPSMLLGDTYHVFQRI